MNIKFKTAALVAFTMCFAQSAMALNPQPEPPGVAGNLSMSVQHSSRTLTAPSHDSCATASTAPTAGATGNALSAGMMAHNNATGAGVGSDVSATADKCKGAAGANSMSAPTAPAGNAATH